MSSIQKADIQLAAGRVQEALQVVKHRMGDSSEMMKALRGIESSLAILLQMANTPKSQVREQMNKIEFQNFEFYFNALKVDFNGRKKDTVYHFLKTPILNVILSVEPIIKYLRGFKFLN